MTDRDDLKTMSSCNLLCAQNAKEHPL